ncbi:MAG: N-acetyl-gamma-glutamyl-phosphate reductase [Pseudomonadota bacterium]
MREARIAVLGASGYAGAELVRLIVGHPGLRVGALAADRRAGAAMGDVYPHLRHLDLPVIQRIEDIDFSSIDLAFCALPHATTQEVVSGLPRDLKIVDLSADFRLRDAEAYATWYGRPHQAPGLQAEAVYGLTEVYRDAIRSARLVAGTGCNAITGLLPILPGLRDRVLDPDDIVISLATGVSGAGRGAKEAMLHAEVSEGFHPYALTGHRHIAEFEQEFSAAAGQPVTCTFLPHLLPQNRGILASCFVKGDANAIHESLVSAYKDEPFVGVWPFGTAPGTRHVRGSNLALLGVVADRRPGRAIVFAATDNLLKGASGQAVQNANLMLGFAETDGLPSVALFP